MKMSKTAFIAYSNVESINQLRDMLEKSKYICTIILTQNLCLMSEISGSIRFANWHASTMCLFTGTAANILRNNFYAERETVYFCERKENKIVAEKIIIIYQINFKGEIAAPFNIDIYKLAQIKFNQFCEKYQDVIETIKKFRKKINS